MGSQYPNNRTRRRIRHSTRRATDFQAARRAAGFAANENIGRRISARSIARQLLKIHPLVRVAFTIYDLYQLWDDIYPWNQNGRFIDVTGWTQISDCGVHIQLIGHVFVGAECGNSATWTVATYNSKLNNYVLTGSYRYAYLYSANTFDDGSFIKADRHAIYRILKTTYDADPARYGVIKTTTQVWPGQDAEVYPIAWTLDPIRMPIRQFLPKPRPLFYGGLPAYRNYQNNHARWWRFRGSPVTQTGPGKDMEVGRTEALQTNERALEFRSVGIGAKGPLPATHSLRRPSKGDKEAKVVVRGLAFVYPLLNTVTESMDFIDVLYNAIPRKFHARYGDTRWRLRHPTPQKQLEIIYRHWDRIDIPIAVKLFILEQLEDYVYGRLGSKLGEQARRNRFRDTPIGFATGPAI